MILHKKALKFFTSSKYFESNKTIIKSLNTLVKNRQRWVPVVGLEIHVQLNSDSKLFSGSSTSYGASVNSNVSLFDAAIPGTLPVLNKKCVELCITTALALSCKINSVSSFDRKHYFYADLPAGYQITQQRSPLAKCGELKFPVFQTGVHKKPYSKISRILQVQLEQDSGKSLHDDVCKRSLIDLNRAGIPLAEIVFAPDLCDGYEAAALVKELILILKRLKTCSCRMEEGALRVDANVSVHRDGEKIGVRTEVKNIGSIRGVNRAINYEIDRQINILQSGGIVINETRAWDALSNVTLPMRDKEIKLDYRFIPEPNLPPLRVNNEKDVSNELINVIDLKNSLPELPEETREKIKKTYNLSEATVFQLVNDEALLSLFNEIIKNKSRDPKIIANILTIELMMLLNKGLVCFDDGKFDENNIGSIVDLLQSKDINLNIAKYVMGEIANGNKKSPHEIVTAENLWQIKDVNELTRICKEVIKNNPDAVKQYKNGKKKVFGALVGMVATETKKKAKMDLVPNLLKKLLGD